MISENGRNKCERIGARRLLAVPDADVVRWNQQLGTSSGGGRGRPATRWARAFETRCSDGALRGARGITRRFVLVILTILRESSTFGSTVALQLLLSFTRGMCRRFLHRYAIHSGRNVKFMSDTGSFNQCMKAQKSIHLHSNFYLI